MLNVAQSISLSLKEMSNVLLILLLVITIFAILGVQLFAGKLHFCNDSSMPDKVSCAGAILMLKSLGLMTRAWVLKASPVQESAT